jgi:large subunit ribosomal protein L24
MALRIKKGDLVQVMTGKEKGAQGKVLRVVPQKNRVVVEKLNLVKRHTRPGQANQQGGIIDKEAPLALSNVMLVDPSDGKPTRVGIKTLDDGRKVRVSVRTGETFN